jgi:SNF family Na+-dependent transporter
VIAAAVVAPGVSRGIEAGSRTLMPLLSAAAAARLRFMPRWVTPALITATAIAPVLF